MHILHGYDHVPHDARGATLAIGNFDGVHRGHQALFQAARAAAAKHGGLAGAIVFEPHPREFFQPDRPHFRLTPLPQKLAPAGALRARSRRRACFDATLAGADGRRLHRARPGGGLGARHVIVGYDFHFGKGRGGNAERHAGARRSTRLRRHGRGTVAEAGEVFSSSAIRAELAQGDVKSAAQMLGH